jgi:hypothetical protein
MRRYRPGAEAGPGSKARAEAQEGSLGRWESSASPPNVAGNGRYRLNNVQAQLR